MPWALKAKLVSILFDSTHNCDSTWQPRRIVAYSWQCSNPAFWRCLPISFLVSTWPCQETSLKCLTSLAIRAVPMSPPLTAQSVTPRPSSIFFILNIFGPSRPTPFVFIPNHPSKDSEPWPEGFTQHPELRAPGRSNPMSHVMDGYVALALHGGCRFWAWNLSMIIL